jgi:hypothetical protein
VHPHLAEVVTKARLEEAAHGSGQWLSTASQGMDLRFQAGIYLWRSATGLLCLNRFFFPFLLQLDMPLH